MERHIHEQVICISLHPVVNCISRRHLCSESTNIFDYTAVNCSKISLALWPYVVMLLVKTFRYRLCTEKGTFLYFLHFILLCFKINQHNKQTINLLSKSYLPTDAQNSCFKRTSNITSKEPHRRTNHNDVF